MNTNIIYPLGYRFGRDLVGERDMLAQVSRTTLERSRIRLGDREPERPDAPWYHTVLRTELQQDEALNQVRRLQLPEMMDTPRNWDSLAALHCILQQTNRRAKILDGGAELYSVLLPWLALYGYTNLTGINLEFPDNERIDVGPISFGYGDITTTGFRDGYFDAVASLSVIERGIDLRSYFAEMARVLRPGGCLITSTSYWQTPVRAPEPSGAKDEQMHIFCETEIREALALAEHYGLEQTQPLDLRCEHKVVYWDELDLDCTFLIFTLRKSIDIA